MLCFTPCIYNAYCKGRKAIADSALMTLYIAIVSLTMMMMTCTCVNKDYYYYYYYYYYCSRSETVLIYIYLNICILHTSSGYMMYIYMHRECRSVLVKLHSTTIYRTVLGGYGGSCVECHLLISLVSLLASCSMINRLLLGCL